MQVLGYHQLHFFITSKCDKVHTDKWAIKKVGQLSNKLNINMKQMVKAAIWSLMIEDVTGYDVSLALEYLDHDMCCIKYDTGTGMDPARWVFALLCTSVISLYGPFLLCPICKPKTSPKIVFFAHSKHTSCINTENEWSSTCFTFFRIQYIVLWGSI